VINRGYDDAGRLTSVARPIGRQSYTTTFGYDADGNVTSETYPNGVVATTGYDRTDRTTSIADTLGATSLVSFAYSRDNAGRLASVQPTGVSQGNETYGYDTLNRLTTVNQPTYAYDAGDNATTLGSATVTYDAANEATSLAQGGLTTTFSYDARGDRTQMAPQGSAATNLVYDQANRLISYGSTATYAYNADGMRMSSTVSGATTQFTWDASGSLPLLLEAGTVDYVYGPGGRAVAQIDVSVPGGAALYYHQDQLGSTRSLTDPSGNVVASFSYDAYGNLTGTTGSTLPNLLYAGQYRDAESGLYYLRARYYDPATGQFLSRDPLVDLTKQPYQYGRDNPLTFTDPTGLDAYYEDNEDQASSSSPGCARYLTGYGQIGAKFGLSERVVRWRIHAAKHGAEVEGNPDVAVDEETGEIYIQEPGGKVTEDSIGNIGDPSPAEKRAGKRGGTGRGEDLNVDWSVLAESGGAGVVITGVGVGLWWLGKGLSPLCGPAAPVCAAAG
jgi:RHS repeat-associated protein